MKNILITTSNFETESHPQLEDLRRKGFNVVLNPYGRRLDENEIYDLMKEFKPSGMIAGVETLSRRVMEAGHNLKVISRCGTGIDSVDIEAANDLGIQVFCTPDAPSDAVAELTIGLILAGLRHIVQADRSIRENRWKCLRGHLLKGKIVGVLGAGRIGKKVGEILNSFGAQVQYYDPYTEKPSKTKFVSLENALQSSDIITLHMPCNDETRHILGHKAFEQMKDGVAVINTARGSLIDEEALIQNLRNNRISFAGLDTFSQEPYTGELRQFEHVLLTCHMGSATMESRALMEREAVENLMNGLEAEGSLRGCPSSE